MIKAKCIKESPDKGDSLYEYLGHDLKVGDIYEVEQIDMGQSMTRFLKDK